MSDLTKVHKVVNNRILEEADADSNKEVLETFVKVVKILWLINKKNYYKELHQHIVNLSSSNKGLDSNKDSNTD